MKHQIIDRTYSVFSKSIPKSRTSFQSAREIEDYMISRIEEHPIAAYITTFDHYKHTSGLENGMIPGYIHASLHVLCCFGMAIPSPEYMAVKPMAIAIVETDDEFVLSFEQAPAPSVQRSMQNWVEGVEDRQ